MRTIKVRMSILVTLLGAVALIVAACGGGAATPTARPTAAPQPTAIPQPTALPQATALPQPTALPRETAVPRATAMPQEVEGPRRGGVLTYVLGRPPSNQDPTNLTYFPYFAFGGNVYSRLTRYNWVPPQDEILPDLAESWEFSADGKTYTFNLRPGVLFHDGKLVTAEDAKLSLELNKSRFAPQLEVIERIEVPDPQTLKLHLSNPRASLPSLLALPRIPIFGKHVYEAATSAGGDLKNGPSIGTGPFILTDYDRQVAIEVERNPIYFLQGLPYLDGIRAVVVSDKGTRLSLFRAGRLQVLGTAATGLNLEEVNDIKSSNPEIQAPQHNVLDIVVIVINSLKPPWDDVRVRRALSIGIDRWGAVQGVAGLDRPAGPPVGPPGWGLSDEALYKLPGYRKGADLKEDQAEAKRLLADAGFPNGIETEILSALAPPNRPTMEFLVGTLGSVGFDIKGFAPPTAEVTARRQAGDFELSMQTTAPFMPDPDGAALAIQPGLFTKLDDAKMLALFDQQSVEGDPDKRRQLVVQLQQRMIEVANIVPVGWTEIFWVQQPEVQAMLPPLSWVDVSYDHVWLTK